MGKTTHHNDRKPGGGGGGAGRHDPTTTNPQTRATLISKSLSRLLRHAAEQERIPIDPHGWARVDHILSWRGLAKFQPAVQLEEVVQGVKDDGKGRFGLRYTGKQGDASLEEHRQRRENKDDEEEEGLPQTDAQTQTETETETARALREFDSSQNQDPKNYMIRANQGHSIKGVSEEGLLTPITLPQQDSNARNETLPKTVVHGTFYGGYEAILSEGALRAMTRNHVHFSSGPDVEIARGDGGGGGVQTNSATTGHEQPPPNNQQRHQQHGSMKNNRSKLAQMMAQSNVKSGMRPDAEILIYIDVEKALRRGMKWWRSENGVLLSEGLPLLDTSADGRFGGGEEEVPGEAGNRANSMGKGKRSEPVRKEEAKGISKEFWLEVIEVKEGLGTLWRDGEVVMELPEHLKGRLVPMGKGRRGVGATRGRGRGRGREDGAGGGRGGGKPSLNVGRDPVVDGRGDGALDEE